MTKTLIAKNDERLKCSSFILIRPKSNYYVINETYLILDDSQLFQKYSRIKAIETYSINDLPESLIFLDSNVPKDIFLDIQKNVFNTSTRVTLKEYPQFWSEIRNIFDSEIDFKVFEHSVFISFEPLTCLEILELYKSSAFYNYTKYKTLKAVVDNCFINKELSVLFFSDFVPVAEILSKQEKIKSNYSKKK